MSHFYLTLPSNASMQLNPNNTAAKYKTELSSAIELSGDWEAALVEISYPRTFYNINDNECRMDLWETRTVVEPDGGVGDICSCTTRVLPKGYYSSVSDVISRIHDLFTEDGFQIAFTLKYDESIGRVVLFVHSPKAIRMSSVLANILGFSRRNFNSDVKYESNLTPDIRRGITSMYVYCDVIEQVVVGDTKVQLLRTLPLVCDSEISINHQTFVNPIYVPVQKKHFDSIEINIITDSGDAVPFTVGKSIAVVHFRRSSNPYFHLSK